MKIKSILAVGIIPFIYFTISLANPDDFPVLNGPYLGQKPPGMIPEIFAPGIISTTASEGCSGFSLDGKLFIFRRVLSRRTEVLLISALKNDRWEEPYKAPFDSPFYEGDFTFAPDGKTLYFSSNRPLKEKERSTRYSNIWVVKRNTSGWSDPYALEYPINTEKHESYPSITKDGTLYFFRRDRDPESKADIWRSKLVNGKFTDPENLIKIFKNKWEELDPFIAPDESYLIFCSERPGGLGGHDFYIRFRLKDDIWTEPIHMGKKINTPASENRPYITLDGKYFFFTSNKSGNRDIYWVDAKIIEEFRPEKLN